MADFSPLFFFYKLNNIIDKRLSTQAQGKNQDQNTGRQSKFSTGTNVSCYWLGILSFTPITNRLYKKEPLNNNAPR